MYARIIGRRVKVVHHDGSHIAVTEGELLAYDEDSQTLLVKKTKDEREVYISARAIDKVEVTEDD